MTGADLLTVEQVAERLQMSPQHVYRLIRTRQLVASNAGVNRRAIYRVTLANLEAFVQDRERPPLRAARSHQSPWPPRLR